MRLLGHDRAEMPRGCVSWQKTAKKRTVRIEGELEGGMVGAFRRLLSSTSSESEGFGQKESRVTELFRRAVDRGSELRGSTEDSLKRAFLSS